MRSQREADAAAIVEYFRKRGSRAFVSTSPLDLLRIHRWKRIPGATVVSSVGIVRKAARRRGLLACRIREVLAAARREAAFEEAMALLAWRKVPVYFYNRIGRIKDGFEYEPAVKRRMEKGLTFPEMLKDVRAHDEDLRAIFGSRYSEDYVRELTEIPQIVQIGGIYRHQDCAGRLVNVVGGRRVTVGQPVRASRCIHVYGRCGAFGYAVEDAETMPSFLQRELGARGAGEVRVVNHGLWGASDDFITENFIRESLGMGAGDIVVFYLKHFESNVLEPLVARGMRYRDITAAWHRNEVVTRSFFDRPGHMNAEGYREVAKLIANDLFATGFSCGPVECDILGEPEADNLYAHLKSGGDGERIREVEDYVNGLVARYPSERQANNGAIVMNCNPFTNGHRALIEFAASQVDRLFVFVVEEDRSHFRFADRLEMVQKGTADLPNVAVVPSGQFIISAYTFPEYFLKDYVREKSFDPSADVRTFCSAIAPALGIRVRFAGEEPFDPVTARYNECMRDILPDFGLSFREIPRFRTAGGTIVSATEVRRLLAESDFKALEAYVPPTTLSILRERYAGERNQGR